MADLVKMHMETSEFVDECGHTITNNGFILSDEKKIGKHSAYTGGDVYLKINNANNDLSFNEKSNFTIQCFLKVDTRVSEFETLLSRDNIDVIFVSDINTNNYPVFQSNGTRLLSAEGYNLYDNKWHHLAITKEANIYRMFIDGKKVDEKTQSATNDFNNCTLGYNSGSPDNTKFVGNIDEFIISDECLYKDDFSVEKTLYQFLIKDKNNLYTYDKTSNSLIDITNNYKDVFSNKEGIYDLDNITQFLHSLSDDVQLVSDMDFGLKINALKSTQEMIATLEPLNMKKYATIHKITPNYTIDGNGSIKIAFSFDDGVTWKTWDATNDWTDLSNVEVPLKLYENFTDADKTAWSNAQSEINTNGIDITNLSTVTFPTDVKKMCFAIVFNRPTYADTATLTSFDILFDGLKTFIGLDRDKCAVKFTGDSITVTPTSNADQLLITMITGTN